MGFFKQLKDMKNVVEAAPDTIAQAQQLQAQAQQMAAAQQAVAAQAASQAAAAAASPTAPSGPDFEPIAGVTLDKYAEISKGLAAYNYDQSKAVEVAASHGVSAENWQQALDGWNARMRTNTSVAQKFNALYTGR